MRSKSITPRIFIPLITLLFTLTISQTGRTQDTGTATSCAFDTPRANAMPNLYYRSYNTDPSFMGSITVIGQNGPDLSPYRKLDFAYVNGKLDAFFFQTWGTFQQVDLISKAVYTFDQAAPELTLSNTGIANFDGSYYVSIMQNEAGRDFQDFIMVSKTGDFTIYFSYSDSPPDCEASEPVVYDERVNGNLSADQNAPTVIAFTPGANRVVSNQTPTADQANFFAFQIPEGYELSQLIVDRYEGSDALGFIGIDQGMTIATTPPSFIGGLTFGTANVGTDILPAMGAASNPAAVAIAGFGFTPPLRAAPYTVWLNQTGAQSSSVLNFVISPADTDLSVRPIEMEQGVALMQYYPNPFERTMTMVYQLHKKSKVRLDVYTLQGQLVKSLNAGIQGAGGHQLTLDLDGMSNGTYLSILVTDTGSKKQRIVLNQ